jgi:GxxExxY protein
MEYQELTKKIIGCAYSVYNKMGFGFLESVYEKCLLIEFRNQGLSVETQKPITIFYDGEMVGDFVVDMIVEDIIIVELKSVKQIAKVHEAQLVNYLVATGKRVGLIINFGEYKVEIRRKVRSLKHCKLSKNKN